MKKTFKSFLNEESEIDMYYQSDDKIWNEFLQQLKILAFRSNYQLETELGFNPKIVIVSKTIGRGFWFIIYQSRQHFLEDIPWFSSNFSITNVKSFFESEIKHISGIKGKDFTIEELLPKFILTKMDTERTY
jgi:hypothetical protein